MKVTYYGNTNINLSGYTSGSFQLVINSGRRMKVLVKKRIKVNPEIYVDAD